MRYLARSSSRRLLVLSLVLSFGWMTWRSVAAQQATAFVTVSAASYRTDSIAPESIVAGFGVNLSTLTASGRDSDPTTPGIQLPTNLVGTTVRVNNVAAPLFFVSPGQINYLIPADTPLGDVPVTVTTESGATAAGTVNVRLVAPAIFTANADGSGVPAAYALRVAANGAQTTENISASSQAANRILATPISLGPEGEKVFLILYPTGLRRIPDPNNDGNFNEFTRVIINGLSVLPAYAGPQGSLVGLDQVNVEIPRSLLGSSALDVQIVVNGFGLSNTTGIELVAPPVTALSFRALGLPTRTIRAFTTIGSYLFAATDQGVWCSSDSGTNWINASNGLPTNADVRTFFVDGTTLYAGLYGGGGVCVSTNNGASWTALNNGLVGSTLNISNILLFGGRLYAATQGGVCRYVNGAWVAINSGITTVDAATFVISGGRLCVGTRGGGIFLLGTSFSTPTWTTLNNGLPSGAQVISFASAGGAVYAGLNGGGLCVSRNGGALWTQVAGGLPTSAVINSIWIDGTRCYVGTATGVYVTNDGGTTWNPLSNGLSGCGGANNTNAVFAFASRLLAGSTGCGVYGSALAAGAANRAPIAYDQSVSFTEDTPIVISLSAFDADLDPLTYSFITSPARGSLTGVLPNVIYTPSANFNGRDAFTFRVNDGRANSNTATISLEGSPINDAPVLNVPGAQTVTVNQPLTFTVSATDPDAGQTVTLSATNLPSGATFNAATGAFAWTPTVAGTYTLTFTATDNGTPALMNTRTVLVTVNGAVATWQTLGTGLSGIGQVWALHAAGATIYAGGNSGIYRSTNSGANWAAFSSGLNAAAALVYRLAFISDKLYAATTGGLYVLNDAATGWTKINNGLPNAPVLSIAGTGATLFVGTHDAGTYRSTDGGATFTLFSSQAFGASSRAIALFIIGDYVLAGGYGSSNQGLYRSLISSPNWTYVNSFGLDFPVSFQLVNNTLYAGGSGYLYLSTDSGLTWTRSAAQAPNTGQFWNFVVTEEGAYCAGTGGLVYFTNNNGASWTNITQGVTSNPIGLIRDGNRLLLGGVNNVYTRPLSGVIANRPPVLTVPAAQTVTTGQALSFNVSATDPDAGQTVTLAATGLPSGATFNAATGAFAWTPTVAGGYTLTFSATDNGTPALTNTRTVSVTVNAAVEGWQALGSVSSGSLDDFYVNGSTIYAATGIGVARSTNGGVTWANYSNGFPSASTPVVRLAFIGNKLFALALTGLFVLNESTNTWSATGTGLPARGMELIAGTGSTVFVASNPGSGVGGIYRSTDGGQTFSVFASTSPVNYGGIGTAAYELFVSGNFLVATGQVGVFGGLLRTPINNAEWSFISSIGTNPSGFAQVGNTLYASGGRNLFTSTDNGATWARFGQDFPAANNGLNSIVEVGGVIYLAARSAPGVVGLLRSTNNGATWTPFIEGLPNNATFGLLRLDGNRLLYASIGTLYTRALSPASNRSPVLTVPVAQTVTTGQALNFTVSATDPDAGQIITLSATGLPSGATFNAGTGAFSWTPTVVGNYTLTFTATDNGMPVLTHTRTVAVTVNASSANGQWTNYTTASSVLTSLVTLGNVVIGGSDRGIFRSTNGGAVWAASNNGLPTAEAPRITSLSVVGTTVYAGLAGLFPGLYRSTDSGANWVAVNATGLAAARSIRAVYGNGSALLLTNDYDVYRSTDNGATWTGAGFHNNLSNARTFPLGVLGSTVIAIAANNANGYAHYRSTDFGANWTYLGIDNGVYNGINGNYQILSVGVNGANLFVLTNAGFYLSTNNGTSFGLITPTGFPVGTGFGAFVVGNGVLYARTTTGVYFSTNNGTSWTAMNTGAIVTGATAIAVSESFVVVSLNTGNVAVSPLPPVPASPTGNWASANTGLPANAVVRDFAALGNVVFAASSLGLLKTSNNGATWVQVSTGSVTETNFYSISVVGDTLYAGSRSFLLASTNGGDTWTTQGAPQEIFLTIVGVVGVGNTLVALGDGSLSATSAFVFVSTNNGQTWTRPTTNLPSGVYKNIVLKGSSIFVGGYSFSSNATEGVMRSDNSGASWVSAGTGLTAGGPFALSLKGTDLFAGGEANGVYRSTNNGTSWTASNGSGTTALPVAIGYKAMTANDSFVFAAGNQSVYFTTNDGAAWSPMTGASVQGAVSLLIVGSQIYAGTPTGIFVSPLPGT